MLLPIAGLSIVLAQIGSISGAPWQLESNLSQSFAMYKRTLDAAGGSLSVETSTYSQIKLVAEEMLKQCEDSKNRWTSVKMLNGLAPGRTNGPDEPLCALVSRLVQTAIRMSPTEEEKLGWATQWELVARAGLQDKALRQGLYKVWRRIEASHDLHHGASGFTAYNLSGDSVRFSQLPNDVLKSKFPAPEKIAEFHYTGVAQTLVHDVLRGRAYRARIGKDSTLPISIYYDTDILEGTDYVRFFNGAYFVSTKALSKFNIDLRLDRNRVTIDNGYHKNDVPIGPARLADNSAGFVDERELVFLPVYALQKQQLYAFRIMEGERSICLLAPIDPNTNFRKTPEVIPSPKVKPVLKP